MKMIAFDRLKKVMLDNVPSISSRIFGGGEWTVGAHSLIGAAKSYVDGKPVRARRVASMFADKVREFILGADVRCVVEMLKLLPKGCDNRLPGWLYGPVDAWLEDKGWVLVPRSA